MGDCLDTDTEEMQAEVKQAPENAALVFNAVAANEQAIGILMEPHTTHSTSMQKKHNEWCKAI